MKRILLIVGLVAALAIPTAAVAAGHRSTHKAQVRVGRDRAQDQGEGFGAAIRPRRRRPAVEERSRGNEDEGAREAQGGDALGPQAEEPPHRQGPRARR